MVADYLLFFDHTLFTTVNQFPHGLISDFIAVLLSAGSGFIWFFLIAVIIFLRDSRIGVKTMTAVILVGVFTYALVVLFLKPIIARPRPDLILNSTISVKSTIDSLAPFSFNFGDYAFPSGHATMAFAAAFVLSKLRSKESFWWYLLAAMIALSRIYLGKHYPGDVVGGAVVGLGVGWIVLNIVVLLD